MPLKSSSPSPKPAAGRASADSIRKKSSPAKTGSRGGERSRKRLPPANRSGSQRGSTLLPFAAIGLLAAALLAGLIYWGVSTPDSSKTASRANHPEPSVEAPKEEQKREKAAERPNSSATSPTSLTSGTSKPPQEKSPSSSAPMSPPPFKPVPAPVSAPPAPVASKEETPPVTIKGPAETPAPPVPREEKPKGEAQQLALATHPEAHIPSSRMESKSLTPAPSPLQIQPPPIPPVARVAIVIDDFGQNLEAAQKFLDLPFPVTFSVLPYLKHSQEVIRLAHDRGHEVMLHLPMEPQEYPTVNPGQGALLVSMTEEKILQMTQAALDASPHIAGVNNHMGSRFTEKTGQMKVVLAELQRRGLFFLDSHTSQKSVGYGLAGEMRLPGARRDIFLDHDPDLVAVRAQIERLIRKAKIEGKAIAIGHPHDSTLKALREAAEHFSREKIAVVSSGELVREQDRGRGNTSKVQQVPDTSPKSSP